MTMGHDFLPRPSQANVNKNEEQSEWRLDALAGKMVQYCYLLEGLTGEAEG
jgi:preprotein translocase subunit SecA